MENTLEKVQNADFDVIYNIDMIESQFSVDEMYKQAKKVGLDLEDLMEYGFNVKAAKCSGKLCRPGGYIEYKNYDEFYAHVKMLGIKLSK